MSYLELKNNIAYLISQNKGYIPSIQKYKDIEKVLKKSMEILQT